MLLRRFSFAPGSVQKGPGFELLNARKVNLGTAVKCSFNLQLANGRYCYYNALVELQGGQYKVTHSVDSGLAYTQKTTIHESMSSVTFRYSLGESIVKVGLDKASDVFGWDDICVNMIVVTDNVSC